MKTNPLIITQKFLEMAKIDIDNRMCKAAMTKCQTALESYDIDDCIIVLSKGDCYEAVVLGDMMPIAYAINQGKDY